MAERLLPNGRVLFQVQASKHLKTCQSTTAVIKLMIRNNILQVALGASSVGLLAGGCTAAAECACTLCSSAAKLLLRVYVSSEAPGARKLRAQAAVVLLSVCHLNDGF